MEFFRGVINTVSHIENLCEVMIFALMQKGKKQMNDKRRSKVNYEEIEKNRWKDFDEKIDSLKEHPKYEWLRKYANDAKSFYDSFGYYQIKAEDFVERIKAATVEQIREWLDGKHGLEWNLLKENKQ